jgi:hypothetical protein
MMTARDHHHLTAHPISAVFLWQGRCFPSTTNTHNHSRCTFKCCTHISLFPTTFSPRSPSQLAGTGSPSTSIDCSGGGRRFWLEYLQAPSYGGKVLPANTWPPCMSSWFSTNTLTRKDLVSEFCWWWGWQMQPKLPDTAQGSDTTWLAEEGSAADKTRWAYMQANLPFEW